MCTLTLFSWSLLSVGWKWEKTSLILLAAGHCQERQHWSEQLEAAAPQHRTQGLHQRDTEPHCTTHSCLSAHPHTATQTSANAAWETMGAVSQWQQVHKEGQPGLCGSALHCLCTTTAVEPESSGAEPIPYSVSKCMCFSYVWHSQKQRQARPFKMYFLVKIMFSTSVTATTHNSAHQHSSLIHKIIHQLYYCI